MEIKTLAELMELDLPDDDQDRYNLLQKKYVGVESLKRFMIDIAYVANQHGDKIIRKDINHLDIVNELEKINDKEE